MSVFVPDVEPENFVSFEHNGKQRRLYGGSFFHAPDENKFFTINLMKEHPLPCSKYIPITDFSQPLTPNEFVEAFEDILGQEKDVYVGCFGGRGRTGLFMSCFLKYIGEQSPLRRVREEYHPHAVETEGQWLFLCDFPKRSDVSSTLPSVNAGNQNAGDPEGEEVSDDEAQSNRWEDDGGHLDPPHENNDLPNRSIESGKRISP